MNKKYIFLILLILALGIVENLYAVSYIPSSEVILNKNVIDLRANRQMRESVNNGGKVCNPGRLKNRVDIFHC